MLSQSSPIPDEDGNNKLLSPSFYNINTGGPGPTCASTSTPILSRQLQGGSRSRRSSASTTCGITPPDSPQKSVSSISKKKRQKSPDDPASAKRNAEFHSMFRSIPEDDLLMDGKVQHSPIHTLGRLTLRIIIIRLWLRITKRDLGPRSHVCLQASHLL